MFNKTHNMNKNEENFNPMAYSWLDENQLAYDIWNKKYRHNNESFDEWIQRITKGNSELIDLIIQKKFLFGGRILANRGLQHKQKITFSNCYVIPPVKDNIEGIYEACAQLARTYSYGGGCGLDISNLRPAGAEVHNTAKTTSGAVSFMSSFNEVTQVIGQNGRRGALMLSIDINHPDVKDFVNIKTDLNKVTSANISVRVNKEFMEAVKNDTDYILRWPCDIVGNPSDEDIALMKYDELYKREIPGSVCYYKKIKAKELFDNLCYNNWNYAEPGILYWDAISQYNLLEYDRRFEYAGVNPCAEEPLPAGGSCLLGSINLAKFVDNGNFLEDEFIEAVHIAVEALNDILDEGLELHPLEIQRKTVGDYRQIGLGVFGYADMLIKLGLRYGSAEANAFTGYVGSILAMESIHKSALLAKERGAYRMWTPEVMKSKFFINHIVNTGRLDIYALVKKYGLRNSQLLTIAPTGTLSTMLNVSGGAEPIFAKSFTRTTKSLHGEDVTYTVYPTIIKEYLENTGKTLDNADDYIVSSEDITPLERVLVQSTWQQYIDASISSTVNLPKQTTVDDVKDIYMAAYENNLKGITIFRAGCARTAILVDTKDVKNDSTTTDIDKGNYIKRPKVIDADYHQIKVKGETFIVLVGKVNDKPYEIFAFRPNTPVKIANHTGKITKNKKMHYSFKSEHIEIPNLQQATDNIEEKAATLYTSMLLRHKADLKYVIKTAKKVNENITSFSSAMCRILSKYVPAEDTGEKCPDCGGRLIRENGCIHCESCGWSMCS